MIVPDEEVVEALLKDARRFKSKWELHTNEPTRSKPNVNFLQRTLTNVVKVNKERMRKPRHIDECEHELHLKQKRKMSVDSDEPSCSKKSKESPELVRRGKSCSKSKKRTRERKKKYKESKKKKKSSRSKSSSKK